MTARGFGMILAALALGLPAWAQAGGRDNVVAAGRVGSVPVSKVVLLTARVDGRPEVGPVLRGGLGRAIAALTACHRRARRSEVGAVGRLALEATIGPKGRIVDVTSTRSTTVGPTLLRCSLSVLKGVSVPAWNLPNRAVASLVFDFVLIGSVPRGTVATGGLTKPMVAGVIQEHLAELSPCLPAGQQKRLILSGVIQFDGRIQRVRASGRRVPRSVRNCIAGKVKGWKFPFGKGGHRTWFQYIVSVTGGPYHAPRPVAGAAGPGTGPAASASGSSRPSPSARPLPRHASRPGQKARPSPKVGLVEVKVGAAFVPQDVDSRILGKRLSRILKRMKKCGGLVPGVSYKLYLQIDRKGKVALVPVTGIAVPKVGMRCLSSAVARVTFPVSATRAHGYRITVTVRGLEGASVKRSRHSGRRRRRRRR